jgi:hypothetical protein
VLFGTLSFGMGDKSEAGKFHSLTTGAFHFLSARDHHYVVAKTATVIQISGSGPFDMTYINPDDDPQKAKK